MGQQGTLCIEGDWGQERMSVKPVLELMKASCGWPYRLKSATTRAELLRRVDEWADHLTEELPVLYLAYHGTEGAIAVRGGTVELDELAEVLDGRATGTLIHFGSCSTFNIDRRHLRRFLDQSGAVAITGFKDDVDWLVSSAFDALLLDTILHHEISPRGLRQLEAEMKKNVGGLCCDLQFRFEYLPYG